jgi:hypothetical protein
MSMSRCKDCGSFFDNDYDCDGFQSGREICGDCYESGMGKIVVWFSCGAASAVAAKKTLEKYPNSEVVIVNNPVMEEHPDNQRFFKDCEQWFGQKIEIAVNKKFPNASADEIWRKVKYMA